MRGAILHIQQLEGQVRGLEAETAKQLALLVECRVLFEIASEGNLVQSDIKAILTRLPAAPPGPEGLEDSG